MYPELGISAGLEAVIKRALEKSPDARFQSMSELSHALSGTPEGRGQFKGRAELAASPTEFHEYQAMPTGAFTEPQFRSQGPASQAPTVTHGAAAPSAARNSAAPATTDAGDVGGALLPEGQPPRGTQAAAAATLSPSKGRAGTLLVTGVMLAAAAGAAWALRRGAQGEPSPAGSVAAEGPPPAPRPLETAAVAAPLAVTSAPAAPASVIASASVRLSVVTDPPGAMLSKDGFQVCDRTPCEVIAAPNETLELEATRDGLTGKAKVLAQRDQNVTIKLAGAAVKKGPAKPRLCEVEVDGIKILRPCQ